MMRHGSRLILVTSVGLLLMAAHASVAQAPPAAATTQPNFVVIVTDDQRWDTIGRCFPTIDGDDMNAGADSCTPNIQADLAANGMTFLKGEVAQSLCCPSRASILTGQYSTTHGVTNNEGSNFDDSSTVATWLDDAGYRTGLFGKYLNGYGSGSLTGYIPPGWDAFHTFHGYRNSDNPYTNYPWINWDSGGGAAVITRYNDINSTTEAACVAGNLYSTDLVCQQAMTFIAADMTQPFFAYVAPAAPHSPNTAAGRHSGMFNAVAPAVYPDYNLVPSPNPPSYLPTSALSSKTLSRLPAAFRAALRTMLAVDDLVGAIHDQLEADGRLANTVWVFISDNGYASGEHRWTSKQCEYWICHRVPFVVVCPATVCQGATPGTIDTEHYALNIDIAPTLAELAGATPTAVVEGQSLVPLLTDPSPVWRTEWFIHENEPKLDGVVAIAGDGAWYKYVSFTTTGEKELFNLTNDPYELANLAGNASAAAIQTDLAARLAAFLS